MPAGAVPAASLTIPNGKGGVRLARSIDEVRAAAEAMIGHTLVTQQTGPAGRPVHRVYVEAGCDIARELYLSLLVDRASGALTLVASTEGGMEIEEVAANHPEKIMRVAIDPATRHVRLPRAAPRLRSRPDGEADRRVRQVSWRRCTAAFIELDCAVVEINPLVVTRGGEVVALDAKISFDDNALFRHPELEKLRDEGKKIRRNWRPRSTT